MAADDSIQPGMEEVQQSPPEVVEETQVIGGRNPDLENETVIMNGENQEIPVQLTNKVGEPNDSPRNLEGVVKVNDGPLVWNESGESSANSSQFLVDNTINGPLTGNKDGPGVQQEMDHQASGVKRKRTDLKKYRSNTLKPSKSLSKKILPDLNLSNEGGLRKKRLRGIRLRKKPGNKGAVEIGDQIEDLDVGDDDLLMYEEWSEGSDEESISENPFLDTAKEIDETIKVGKGVGVELDGFEDRVTNLVTGLAIQSGSR
ncbi:hypothetical protein L1987_12086 [Smallanthus sonchifolius]|uniref:Uncharacterized protein n=1 Tax=Smallanthus sonchifolius TaxID=185202 RepID=A0ACB9JDQ0_9ASTR|nr:hypothetical protein L1987_12086 [Smallanthus sonchifolius]